MHIVYVRYKFRLKIVNILMITYHVCKAKHLVKLRLYVSGNIKKMLKLI